MGSYRLVFFPLIAAWCQIFIGMPQTSLSSIFMTWKKCQIKSQHQNPHKIMKFHLNKFDWTSLTRMNMKVVWLEPSRNWGVSWLSGCPIAHLVGQLTTAHYVINKDVCGQWTWSWVSLIINLEQLLWHMGVGLSRNNDSFDGYNMFDRRHVFHMFDRCVWQPDGQKQARVCGYVRCSGEICFWFSYRLFSTLVVVSCSYVQHSVGFWFDFIIICFESFTAYHPW